MKRNKKKFGQKLEDRRAEYTVLRTEILQSDRTCLLMMGYLFAAVGFLYANDSEWLVSLLSFVSLCYFTEKRFSIRLISTHIANTGGFEWDKKVAELREKRQLRPCPLLRPYNVEALTCLFIAFSPLFNGIYDNFGKLALNLWNHFCSNHFHHFEKLLPDLINYFGLLCNKFCQLNPNLTDRFWLLFSILTLGYSIYSLIIYNLSEEIYDICSLIKKQLRSMIEKHKDNTGE